MDRRKRQTATASPAEPGGLPLTLGDGPEAVRRADIGLRLSPLDAHIFFAEHILSQSHYVNGDMRTAIQWAMRSRDKNRRLTSNLRVLAAGLVATNRNDEARSVANEHARLSPNFRLSSWSTRTPLRGPLLDRLIGDLTQAGFPS